LKSSQLGRSPKRDVARGSISLNGQTLKEGDGVPISTSGPLRIKGSAHAEALLFDMRN
jgi:redox-sensitive bicupin YhaK (pirin superfamily)